MFSGNSVCKDFMGKEMKPARPENQLTKIHMTSINRGFISGKGLYLNDAIIFNGTKCLQILPNTYSKCVFTVCLFYKPSQSGQCTLRHLISSFSLAG